MALLELINLSYVDNQHKFEILSDISFKVPENQVLGIAGESGGGKTTLGLIIAGILKQSAGEILLNGTPAINLINNTDIQILLQNRGELINPYRQVKSVLKEAFSLTGKKTDSESAISDMLDKLKLKKDILRRKGYELSGGEQQRIALARILFVKPKILILDEPFSAQDINSEVIIINLLKKLNEESGLTIICISHDLKILKYFAEKLIILHKGKIIETGDTKDVLNNPIHPFTKFFVRAEDYSLSRDELY
jgi:ABC-type dipeptide/oligopeptide/nickel transport system ATPase subunit